MSEDTRTDDALNDRRFADMTFNERLVFVAKTLVFFVSGGFIFPTMWVD